MSSSTYSIEEYRCLFDGEDTHLYVRISDSDGIVPIGGWYHKKFTKRIAPIHELQLVLVMQEFLHWEKSSPPATQVY